MTALREAPDMIEPTGNTDPTEPIYKTEPFERIDNTDLLDLYESFEDSISVMR